jgi:hypothetical protein
MKRELEPWQDDQPELFALAKLAHAEQGPDEAQLARMFAGLARDTQVDGDADASPELAARASKVGPTLGARAWWPKLMLITVLLAGVWLGVRELARAPRTSELLSARVEPSTVDALPPSAPEQRAPQPRLEPASESAQVPPEVGTASPTKRVVTRTRSALPADPAAELALLQRARRVLEANPARALALAEEHAVTYRRGVLVEERELLAVEALVRLGRTAQAQQRARNFSRAYPHSVHHTRLGVILKRAAD